MRTHLARVIRFNHKRLLQGARAIVCIAAALGWTGCSDASGDDGSTEGTLDPCTGVVGECHLSSSSSGSDSGDDSFSEDNEAVDSTAEDASTLCYEVTQSGSTENLELKCTPDTSLSCAELGLDATSYVYSSWSTCIDDAENVSAHWQRTGDIGGASPDTSSETGSGTAPSSSPTGGQCSEGTISVDDGEVAPRGDATIVYHGCFLKSDCPTPPEDVSGSVTRIPRGDGGWCLRPAAGCLPSAGAVCDGSETYHDVIAFQWRYTSEETGQVYEGQWFPSNDGDSIVIEIPPR